MIYTYKTKMKYGFVLDSFSALSLVRKTVKD